MTIVPPENSGRRNWVATLTPPQKSLLIVGVCGLLVLGGAMIVNSLDGFDGQAAAQPTSPQTFNAPTTPPVTVTTPVSQPPLTTPVAEPPPKTARPVLPVGVTGPGYVVAATWPDDALGPGAKLVIQPANLTTARTAIAHYAKTYGKGFSYLWIETVSEAGADSWMCAGEYLTSAAQDRILEDQPAPTKFPTTIVQCAGFAPVGGGVYYANCAAARTAGAAPVHRGEPGYGRHLDRDGDGVGCE